MREAIRIAVACALVAVVAFLTGVIAENRRRLG